MLVLAVTFVSAVALRTAAAAPSSAYDPVAAEVGSQAPSASVPSLTPTAIAGAHTLTLRFGVAAEAGCGSGSVGVLLDQTGGVKASYGYSAYGSVTKALAAGFSASVNPYRYTSKRYDSGSATLDMGARRYSPTQERFLQPDQYDNALDNLALARNAATNNRYQFTGANPVNYIEIDGHIFVADPGGKGNEVISCYSLTGAYRTHCFSTLYPDRGAVETNDEDYLLIAVGGAGIVRAVGRKTARAAGDAIGSGAKKILCVFTCKKAAKAETEIVQRAMSQAELDATLKTGLVRGGRSGTHYASDAVNSNAKRARRRLALPQTPEVRVDLEVPKGVFGPPTFVNPKYGMPGGGLERSATGPVRCRVVGVRRYC